MVECFDDFDTADILDDSGIHLVRRLYCARIFFLVVAHDNRHEDHTDGNGDEREKRHASVEDEQIDEDAQGTERIRCQLRP